MFSGLLRLLQDLGWLVLGVFSLHRLWLLGLWARYRGVPPRPGGAFAELPFVTVQLPVFNERYVVERLLEAVARLDYPRERLEIQVLDDSTDETSALVASRVAALQAAGWQATHVRRAHRSGFKAGALAEGLALAQGEFLALFDADFVPPSDFLRRTIHYFTDPRVGMVQTRWDHLNRSESALTRAQAFLLDGHFLIEQIARSRAGYFCNFNGSAGIWRRETIIDAGGWQPDTLTEDLDLSYRAQLRDWRFLYLRDIAVPAEVPGEMNSLKAQQHRWTKGSIQTALKVLPAVWSSRKPWYVKLESCFHLGNWFHYPLGVLVTALILPSLMMASRVIGVEQAGSWQGLFGLLLFATTMTFYAIVQRQIRAPWWRFVLDLPVLMAVSVAVTLSNSRAIWEALSGRPSAFHRTPKGNGKAAAARSAGYQALGHRTTWWWTEMAFGLYVCVAVGYAASQALYGMVPFLLPLSAGFLYAALSSMPPADSLKADAPADAGVGLGPGEYATD